MSAALELPNLFGEMTVDEWVEADPTHVLVLRRESDGIEMQFCPTRESYQDALKAGVIAFMPVEVKAILEAVAAADNEGKRAALADLLRRCVEVKRAIPGAKVMTLLNPSYRESP